MRSSHVPAGLMRETMIACMIKIYVRTILELDNL